MSTAPIINGGITFQAKLRPGPVNIPSPAAADFRAIKSVPTARELTAAASHVINHSVAPAARDAISAAAIAIRPP